MVSSVTLKFARRNSAVLAERRAGVSSPVNSDVKSEALVYYGQSLLTDEYAVKNQSEAYEHRSDASYSYSAEDFGRIVRNVAANNNALHEYVEKDHQGHTNTLDDYRNHTKRCLADTDFCFGCMASWLDLAFR